MNKKRIITFFKLALSLCLVVYLFGSKVDLKQVFHIFSGIHPGWLLAGGALHLTGLLFSACRWRFLLDAQKIRQPISRLFSYYLVGHFFNMFLPTKVGGDFMRIYDTSRDHGSAAEPLAVVLVERISGMLTMLLIAAFVLLLHVDIGVDFHSRIPYLNVFLTCFIFILFLFPLFFHPKVELLLSATLFNLPVVRKLRPFTEKIFMAFRIYAHTPKHLGAALFFGFLLQLNYFFHYYFLARSLGIDVSFSFFFVIIPIRTVTLMIPFFINGIGLREFFDITAFSLIHVSENAAVAFAELAWLIQIAFALLGGLVYVFRKR